MAKPISNDKRAAIVKHMQVGENKENIAKWLFVCVRTVTRVWDKFNATGNYEAAPQNSGRKPAVTPETMEKVVLKIKEMPDMTLLELINEFDLPLSQSALCRRLIKLGLTFKKRHFTR
jgi:transposase